MSPKSATAAKAGDEVVQGPSHIHTKEASTQYPPGVSAWALCLLLLPELTSAQPWGPRRAQRPLGLGCTQQGDSSASLIWPVCPHLPTEPRRGDLISHSQGPSSPTTTRKGENDLGNVSWQRSPTNFFFFFLSLLEILTKPWPWSGPACPKLLPGNHHPAPSSPSRSSLGYLPAGKPISHCHPTVVRLQVPAVPHRPVEKGRAMKLPTQLPTALPPVSPCELFELKYKEWAAETHPPPSSLGLLFKSMHRFQTWRLPRFYGPFAPSLGVLGFQDAHAHGRAYACWCVLGPWWHLPPCPWLQLLLLP